MSRQLDQRYTKTSVEDSARRQDTSYRSQCHPGTKNHTWNTSEGKGVGGLLFSQDETDEGTTQRPSLKETCFGGHRIFYYFYHSNLQWPDPLEVRSGSRRGWLLRGLSLGGWDDERTTVVTPSVSGGEWSNYSSGEPQDFEPSKTQHSKTTTFKCHKVSDSSPKNVLRSVTLGVWETSRTTSSLDPGSERTWTYTSGRSRPPVPELPEPSTPGWKGCDTVPSQTVGHYFLP